MSRPVTDRQAGRSMAQRQVLATCGTVHVSGHPGRIPASLEVASTSAPLSPSDHPRLGCTPYMGLHVHGILQEPSQRLSVRVTAQEDPGVVRRIATGQDKVSATKYLAEVAGKYHVRCLTAGLIQYSLPIGTLPWVLDSRWLSPSWDAHLAYLDLFVTLSSFGLTPLSQRSQRFSGIASSPLTPE